MANQTSQQTVISQTALPDWYTSYLQQTMGRALTAADSQYQPYTGPMVAGLSPDQQQAYQEVQQMQGGQTGTLKNALGLYDQAGGVNSGAAGQGSYDAASGYFGAGAGANTAGVSSPFVNQGIGYASQAANGNSAAAGYPYITGSTNPTGLQAAAPFLSQASQGIASASGSFPQSAAAYMNPYNSAVTDQIAKLGARNLTENLLPGIADNFVSAGQYGSQRQGVMDDRALRDTQEAILGQQANVLQQGYQTAGNQYEADQSRLAGLAGTAGSLAGTAGGLGTQQQQILQSAGLGLGNLSAADLNRILSAGQTVGQLGIGQAGVAGTDANRQIAAGQGMAGIGASQIQSAQSDNAQRLAAAGGINGLATNAQTLGMQQAAALEAGGASQQANTQANYNAAYNQFQQQQQYPWQVIGNLSNVVQGLPVNQSTSQSSTSSVPGPSTTSQIAGIGLGVAGLANSGIFKARGGAVKKPKSRVSYGIAPRRGIGALSMREAA